MADHGEVQIWYKLTDRGKWHKTTKYWGRANWHEDKDSTEQDALDKLPYVGKIYPVDDRAHYRGGNNLYCCNNKVGKEEYTIVATSPEPPVKDRCKFCDGTVADPEQINPPIAGKSNNYAKAYVFSEDGKSMYMPTYKGPQRMYATPGRARAGGNMHINSYGKNKKSEFYIFEIDLANRKITKIATCEWNAAKQKYVDRP